MHVQPEEVSDAVGEEHRVGALFHQSVDAADKQPLVDESPGENPRRFEVDVAVSSAGAH